MKNFYSLFKKDFVLLFRSKTVYAFYILSSFFFGVSLLTALNLYGDASKAAFADPVYAKGFEPVPGVFVPSFGALFLTFTLLLPFCIIPLASEERRRNTVLILWQYKFRKSAIVVSKFAVSAFAVLTALFIPLVGVMLWLLFGGHLWFKEIALLFLGYFLYGLTVSSISLFSGSVFSSQAQAAVLAYLLLLYSWVIDFLKTVSRSPLLEGLSPLSLTALLKEFESGVFSPQNTGYFLFFMIFFLFLYFLFSGGIYSKRKIFHFSLIILALVFFFLFRFFPERDFTESGRNSFPPSVVEGLKKIPKIKIKIFLRKTDSRLVDYKKEFLDRLTLVRPDIEVEFAKGRELEENYGIFLYCVKNKKGLVCEKTFSNSPEEAFMVLSSVSGIKIPFKSTSSFPGYPLVFPVRGLVAVKVLFLFFIPLLFVFIFLFVRIKRFFNGGGI